MVHPSVCVNSTPRHHLLLFLLFFFFFLSFIIIIIIARTSTCPHLLLLLLCRPQCPHPSSKPLQLYRLTVREGTVEGPVPLSLPTALPSDPPSTLWRWAGGRMASIGGDGSLCVVDPLRTLRVCCVMADTVKMRLHFV